MLLFQGFFENIQADYLLEIQVGKLWRLERKLSFHPLTLNKEGYEESVK